MKENKKAVEFEDGKSDILVLAPHAVENDDDNRSKKKNISVKKKISSDMLESLKPEKIRKLKSKIAKWSLKKRLKQKLAIRQKNLKTINKFLEEKVEASQAVKELPN